MTTTTEPAGAPGMTCVHCLQPLEHGEAEEARTLRTVIGKKYFCMSGPDALHHAGNPADLHVPAGVQAALAIVRAWIQATGETDPETAANQVMALLVAVHPDLAGDIRSRLGKVADLDYEGRTEETVAALHPFDRAALGLDTTDTTP